MKLPETKLHKSFSSDRGLAASIGKNTIFGVLSSVVWAGTRLITVPIVISHLGLGGYGIWSIIMATGAYMRFGTAGIKSAFQKYVAEATGTGDYEKASRLVSTGSICILILSILGLIPIAVFSRKIAKASGVPPEFLVSAAASITLLAFTYLISNFGAAFEAIVTGGHRLDLTRKFNTVLAICEAIAILAVLHFGYGLLAMTSIMAASELIYIFCCYLASHAVVPEIRIRIAFFTKSMFPELIRFAGSYQLVNVLEVLYGAICPIILLKFFGADAAGVVAVAVKVVSTALIAQDALLLPILSGGTMVFASGSSERMRLFLAKSFKMTLMTSLPPLAFVCVFGTKMVLAWTGQATPLFLSAIWLIALGSLFKAVSLLQLILYRSTGKALLDNVRQILRIAATLTVAFFAKDIGFIGVLAGMAGAEFIGVIFMFFAMKTTFRAFSGRMFANDAFRIGAASCLIVGIGALAGLIPVTPATTPRVAAALKLCEVSLACMIVAWPALVITKSVSGAEKRSLLDAIIPGRKALAGEGA
jgi:O-antigen/teichoic acid export membrane protein